MNAVLKQPMYQVKMGSRWSDMELGISNLANLAANIMALKGPDLQAIHRMVMDYHGTTKTADPSIHDVVGIQYNLDSVDADTLKFSYSFTVRYGNEKEREKAEKARIKHAEKERKTKSSWPAPQVVKPSREITGSITIMPGN